MDGEKIEDTYININKDNQSCNFTNKWVRINSFIVSTRLTAILFLVSAFAMGIGTFIETYYTTDTAKILIYNATWFELILVIFVINFVFNIKRYNLLKFNKWPVLMLHLSWILIILGPV